MAIASVGTLGTGANSTSNSSYTFNTATNSLAAGDFGILVNVTDNTSTTDGDNNEHTSVSGGTGTWTKLGEYTNSNGAAAAGVTTSVWLFEASDTVNTGTTMTLNFASNRTDKAASFWKFTKAASTEIIKDSSPASNPITSQVDAATGFGSSAFSGLASAARLYFRGLGKEANSTTQLTVSTSFTAITVARSRNNASAVLTRGEFRINTSTGETSNPTLAVTGDTAGLFFALLERTNHSLTATGLATGAPTVGSPAITQAHALTATGVSAGAPTVGAPELTENSGSHDLTANSIATGAPTVGSPAITQAHGLTATGIATGAPTVGSPAITQAHALAANGVATSAPTVGSPAISQAHGLTATGISTGVPTVGTPALSQAHALTAAGVATGAPSVGSPALTQAHGLSAVGIATGAPTVGAPAISQVHALEAVGIATGAPTVGTPGLNGGTVDLVANGISTGASAVGTPELTETVTNFFVAMGGGGGSPTANRNKRKKKRPVEEELPTVERLPSLIETKIDRASVASRVIAEWKSEQEKAAAEAEADDEEALLMMAA